MGGAFATAMSPAAWSARTRRAARTPPPRNAPRRCCRTRSPELTCTRGDVVPAGDPGEQGRAPWRWAFHATGRSLRGPALSTAADAPALMIVPQPQSNRSYSGRVGEVEVSMSLNSEGLQAVLLHVGGWRGRAGRCSRDHCAARAMGLGVL